MKRKEGGIEAVLRGVSITQHANSDALVESAIRHHLVTRWFAGNGSRPFSLQASGYWPDESYDALTELLDSVPHVDLGSFVQKRPDEDTHARAARERLLGSRETPEGYVRLHRDHDGEILLDVATTDSALYERLVELIRGYNEFERGNRVGKERCNAFMLVAGRHGLGCRAIGLAAAPLVRTNYGEKALLAFDTLLAELRSAAPTGRLALITGPSGTGKSYLIRGLMDELPDIRFLFLPPGIVGSLGQPELLDVLLELRDNNGERRTVIVAEDADAVLVSREMGSPSVLSTMLNLTSGVVGELLDVRIVATTNAEHFEVDAALRRPGRLIDLGVEGGLEIGRLDVFQARDALANLLEGDPDRTAKAALFVEGEMTLAAVYMQARRLGWRG